MEQAAPTIRIESLAGDEVPVPNRRPQAPDPVRLTADAQGAISGTVLLAPGRWELTLAAEGQDRVTRQVTVGVGDGLSGCSASAAAPTWRSTRMGSRSGGLRPQRRRRNARQAGGR